MQFTDKDIQEFQSLWRKEFDEEISFDNAQMRASELLELYALLARAPWIEGDVNAPLDAAHTNSP
jgi:hypothetical protein